MQNKTIRFQNMTVKERTDYLEEHFLYEVESFFFTFNFLSKLLKDDSKNIELINMALDNFLLHVKLLYEFFYDNGKGTKSPYIRAWHYLGTEDQWGEVRLNKLKEMKELNGEINTKLSHFGSKRNEKKDWNEKDIFCNIKKEINVFIDNLPHKYSSQKLQDKFSELNKLYGLNKKEIAVVEGEVK